MIRIADRSELPETVAKALEVVGSNRGALDPIAVNWNLTCLSDDGGKVLQKATLFEGGSRSGQTCGEDDMWAVPQDTNNKNVAVAGASKFFGELKAVYFIDAGLCPCLRCCTSLLNLAKHLNSTLIVRPMTDYEILRTERTAPDKEQIYLLVFTSDATEACIYHDIDLGPRDVTQEPPRAWYECLAGHEITVEYPSEAAKRAEKREAEHRRAVDALQAQQGDTRHQNGVLQGRLAALEAAHQALQEQLKSLRTAARPSTRLPTAEAGSPARRGARKAAAGKTARVKGRT